MEPRPKQNTDQLVTWPATNDACSARPPQFIPSQVSTAGFGLGRVTWQWPSLSSHLRHAAVTLISHLKQLFDCIIVLASSYLDSPARFLFMQYPFVARALSPLEPLMGLYHAFPFAP